MLQVFISTHVTPTYTQNALSWRCARITCGTNKKYLRTITIYSLFSGSYKGERENFREIYFLKGFWDFFVNISTRASPIISRYLCVLVNRTVGHLRKQHRVAVCSVYQNGRSSVVFFSPSRERGKSQLSLGTTGTQLSLRTTGTQSSLRTTGTQRSQIEGKLDKCLGNMSVIISIRMR